MLVNDDADSCAASSRPSSIKSETREHGAGFSGGLRAAVSILEMSALLLHFRSAEGHDAVANRGDSGS